MFRTTLRPAGSLLFALGWMMQPRIAAAQATDLADALVAMLPAVTIQGRKDAESGYVVSASSSATRTDTPLRDVPQAVTVVTRQLIQDQGMRSMADLVRYVPGVSMAQGEGHRDAPTLRGNSSTADFFVDGVRDDLQYFRDLYNAERIEVLKGPNAMIFGRGGGGGVINRVTRWADGSRHREVELHAGGDGQLRASTDLGTAVGASAAWRINAVTEDSGSYRDHVRLRRHGFNPTLLWKAGAGTTVRAGIEHFSDRRTVDRGVPSLGGSPAKVDPATFFGNPALSHGDARVGLASVALEHHATRNLTWRSRAALGDYDKQYQNVHARTSVDALGMVGLQAYASDTQRRNAFHQTDLAWWVAGAQVSHQLLVGVELGSQRSRNRRTPNNDAAGSVSLANPTSFAPVSLPALLQSDNVVDVRLAAIYVQDQLSIGAHFKLLAGARLDQFSLSFDDRRPANADAQRTDRMVSPRLGLIYQPSGAVSLYASYTVSHLPQSGDQFGSLTATTAALEPERFRNLEIGLKQELRPGLVLEAAAYRLERSNTTATDPVGGQLVLAGRQRTQGLESGLTGTVNPRWQVSAGFARQDARIVSDTASAPRGRRTPLVPALSLALWNRFQLTPRWAGAIGVTRQSDSYASISNAVTLPAYARVDVALYWQAGGRQRLQLNLDNLLDARYYPTAHTDSNITPGAPIGVRLAWQLHR